MEINAPDVPGSETSVPSGLFNGSFGNFKDAVLAGLPTGEQIANTLGLAALDRLADRIGNRPANGAYAPGASQAKRGTIADVGVQFDLSPNVKLLLVGLAVLAIGVLIYRARG